MHVQYITGGQQYPLDLDSRGFLDYWFPERTPNPPVRSAEMTCVYYLSQHTRMKICLLTAKSTWGGVRWGSGGVGCGPDGVLKIQRDDCWSLRLAHVYDSLSLFIITLATSSMATIGRSHILCDVG